MGIGIYVHIPFCLSKCAYCDFYSLPRSCYTSETKTHYIQALIRHFKQARQNHGSIIADTVFIGGGTPTSLDTEQLTLLINGLKDSFDVTRNTEFTVEANPATFDEGKLLTLKALGVNRLSIGVQSALDSELKAIGRAHSYKESTDAFKLARKCGFDNISVDLMFGLPYQTEKSFLYSINEAIKLSPEHISVYGLQLEEDTPLYRLKGSDVLPNDDECVKMFSSAISLLDKNGYPRYEISNFAKEGFECRHNLTYWSAMEYLGFGAGAYSYFDSKRFFYKQDVEKYCLCEDFSELMTIEETLGYQDKEREFIMLSLRLCKGISLKELNERTRNPKFYLDKFEKYVKSEFMQILNGRLSFTEKGFNVSNTILSEILF